VEPPPESNRRPHPYHRCAGGSQRRAVPPVTTNAQVKDAAEERGVGRGKVACSALSGRSLARALHRRPWAWTPTLHPLWLASNAEIAGEQDSLGVRSPGCGFGDAEDSGRRPALPRDVLDHLLDAVRGGAGRAVVRDEPGVGKTALLDYLVEQASGCRVARVAGASRKIELAFAGLHRLCADAGHLERLPRPSARCCGPPEIDATSSRGRCQVARVDRPAVPGPNGPGHSRPRWNAHGAGQQAPGTPGQTGNSRWMLCLDPTGRLH
jgi:hypothetical protein